MPDTSEYAWPMPTPGGSPGTWGTELNVLFDDHIEPVVKAVSDVAAAALPKAGGDLTGPIKVGVVRVGTVALASITSGGNTVNLALGDVFHGLKSGAAILPSITFSNPPAAGLARFFVLEIENGNGISWPPSVKWSPSAPTLKTTGVDVLVFYTRDGGVTYRGVLAHTATS